MKRGNLLLGLAAVSGLVAILLSVGPVADARPSKASTGGVQWVTIGPVQDTEIAMAAQLMEDNCLEPRGQLPIRQEVSAREGNVSFTVTFNMLGRRIEGCSPGNSSMSLARSVERAIRAGRH